MTRVDPGAVVEPAAEHAEGSERVGVSIPFSVVALVVAVLALALLALPIAVAGFIAAAVIAIAVALAVVAVARAVRRGRGFALAVTALGVAVLTGTVATAIGVGTTIVAATDAYRESGVVAPSDVTGDGAAAPEVDADISGQWVVDELLRECHASHLHAVAAPGSTTLFLVGERPVSVDDFSFTVTVEPGADTWHGKILGDVPEGSDALTGSSANPLECESVEIDAFTGNLVTAGGDEAGGSDAPPAPAGEVNYWELEVGMCLNDANLPERFTTIPLVDCAQSHDSEVYAILPLADGPYPGDEEVFRLAEDGCYEAYEPYVGMSYDTSYYYFAYYWPDKNGWGAGDRNVVCIVYDENGQIEGSVRGSGR
ncbi:septum formation family protein [Microcella sp.]|uniref:septum formation family protein n=1 Tax=Microcella sp. TaxID=1913979 RepID=UPI00299F764F|nr:septum formation family protein [Microcella sp.]MDX2024796.1 septum formation family protein [Microcella sp.]